MILKQVKPIMNPTHTNRLLASKVLYEAKSWEKKKTTSRFFVSLLIEIKLKVKEGTQIIFKNKMSRNLNRTNMSNHSGFTIWKFNNTMLSRCNSSKKSDAMVKPLREIPAKGDDWVPMEACGMFGFTTLLTLWLSVAQNFPDWMPKLPD